MWLTPAVKTFVKTNIPDPAAKQRDALMWAALTRCHRNSKIVARRSSSAIFSSLTGVSRPLEGEGLPLPTQQGGPSSQHELKLHLHRWKLTVTSFDPQLQTNTVAAAAQRTAPQPFDQGRVPVREGASAFISHYPACVCCLCLQLVRKCHKSRVWLISGWKDTSRAGSTAYETCNQAFAMESNCNYKTPFFYFLIPFTRQGHCMTTSKYNKLPHNMQNTTIHVNLINCNPWRFVKMSNVWDKSMLSYWFAESFLYGFLHFCPVLYI